MSRHIEQAIFHDTAAYLERLDEKLASLQQLADLARRYENWCDAHYAELDTRRRELGAILDEWQETDS